MEDKDLIDLDDNFSGNQNLPNATAVLVLGIISIATCWLYGLPGIVCGIIALVLYKRDNTLYKQNPKKYTEASYKNLKAGYICGIIGLILSALMIIYVIWAIFFISSIGGFDSLYKYRKY